MPEGITQLTAGFSQPAVDANVTIEVVSTTFMVAGQEIFIGSGGYYEVQSITDATDAIVQNRGYDANAAPGTPIASGQGVSPAGEKGETGATPSVSLSGASGLSPTTTKGDIIVDNGGGSPNPSVVRLAAGTNGQSLVADSGTAAGLKYATIVPNATATPADTDNIIPRFNAAAGNEVPAGLQRSGLLVSDTGAIQSTPTGGDARGASAVDLQVVRVGTAEVASGTASVIAGGRFNTSSGFASSVGGGDTNTASGDRACVPGGGSNSATGDDSVCAGGSDNEATGDDAATLGGNANTASGDQSTTCGGLGNNATGNSSVCLGGASNDATEVNAVTVGGANNEASAENSVTIGGSQAKADKYGQVSHSAGMFAVRGDAQHTPSIVFRISTTDATPAIAYLDGTGERATISENTSWTFRGVAVGRRDNGDTAHWKFEGGIHNNGGTTALTAAVTSTVIAADAGCSGTWGQAANLLITADAANDALQVEFTGTAANNIRVVIAVELVEVSY